MPARTAHCLMALDCEQYPPVSKVYPQSANLTTSARRLYPATPDIDLPSAELPGFASRSARLTRSNGHRIELSTAYRFGGLLKPAATRQSNAHTKDHPTGH